jgi:hypothetical protein
VKPIELFRPLSIDPGHLPEFELGVFPPGCEHTVAVIPARGRPAEVRRQVGSLYVPHFGIANQADEAQAAIDLTVNEVNDEAWRLLVAAGEEQPEVVADSEGAALEAMRGHFGSLFKDRPDRVQVRTCRRDGVLVGVYWGAWMATVLTIHEPPTLYHTPHTKPFATVDCGFGVLECNAVLIGKIRHGDLA